MGYLHDAEASAAAIDERGWVHSGDIGVSDRPGFLFITGRVPDIIMPAGGACIPPTAAESAIKVPPRFIPIPHARLPARISH